MGLNITLAERSETRMVKDTSHRIHVSFSLKDARLQDSSLVSGKFTLLVCNTHIIICVQIQKVKESNQEGTFSMHSRTQKLVIKPESGDHQRDQDMPNKWYPISNVSAGNIRLCGWQHFTWELRFEWAQRQRLLWSIKKNLSKNNICYSFRP